MKNVLSGYALWTAYVNVKLYKYFKLSKLAYYKRDLVSKELQELV